ncbi:MAG: ABC transporter permease [Anaerolineae bacterium]
MIASFGFFFLPLLEIKPNRLASGVPINLFEIEGDLRYVMLFILALVPLVIAFQSHREQRGWWLVIIGNLILFLTLLLPVSAAEQLLSTSDILFEEGTRISNPRIFASSAIAVGLLGGYIILFGGLRDLVAEHVQGWLRFAASTIGIFLIVIALFSGSFDIYSILVEFSQRGATLGQRFIEHLVFVIVSLIAGLIIGISLGLWAARDEYMEDIILYAVSIIQTIPSLALFGVLLVPLARLGDQNFLDVFQLFVVMMIAGVIVLLVMNRLQSRLPDHLRPWTLIVSFLVLSVPVALFAILLITFSFRSVLVAFTSPDLRIVLSWVAMGYGLFILLLWLDQFLDEHKSIRWLRYSRLVVLGVSTIAFIILLFNGGQQVIGNNSLNELTIRNLGVSGIGTAPAIIALTLYSLLPLVRNTYTGLRNVDDAIIDSGRGLGMTPAQVFFQIELPLALPIIMAGIRNAGISLVGIAAVASIIGAGALGDFILLGVNTTSVDLILLGAIPAIILAILLDAILQLLESLLTSPGIRQASSQS